ncbi:MAG: alpha/beta fold hydrolase [Promethearchaeota archaeon]|nr:MAG: alpha/beta fold hydrolase [Candidatus Lokiarchaeota archaeon]
MENIQIENIDIPIRSDNINLKGSIYYTANTPSKAPWILNLAGMMDHRESYFVKYYSEKFADAGYYVLAYDYRGHGETAEQTGKNVLKMIDPIFSDLNIVLTWIIENQSNRLLDEKITLFGRSWGGAIMLTRGYVDQRAKKLIALCTRFDYRSVGSIKFPEEIVKRVSPKYFLKKDPLNDKRILIAHCRDDPRIPFDNLIQIKEQLGLSEENVVVYDTGGHSFKGHRDEIFEKAIEFIKQP